MVQNKIKKIMLTLLLLVNLASMSVLANVQGDYSPNYVSSQLVSVSDEFEDNEWDYENPIEFLDSPKILYNAVETYEGAGNNFDVEDELSVSHGTTLYLNKSNGRTDTFDIQDPDGIGGFSEDYFEYGMSITTLQDEVDVHVGAENKHQVLTSSKTMVAQAFQISWDYAVLYHARINLVVNGPTLDNDVIRIYVVSEDGLGEPNLGDIRAYDVNENYSSINMIPTSTLNNYATYDLVNSTLDGEAILERGTYFVVIELILADGTDDDFDWLGKIGAAAGTPCYTYNGTIWSSPSPVESRGLVVNLLPSDFEGNALVITDPSDIALTDDAGLITSLTDQIEDVGVHSITSNTSIEITMINTYNFTATWQATSQFDVSNSSFLSESVNWQLNWSIGELNIPTDYSNPTRALEIQTAGYWNDTVFSLLVDDSFTLPGDKGETGYSFVIDTLFSNNSYATGDFSFTTTSLNYLHNLNLNSDTFYLGTWIPDGENATGIVGSEITAGVYVKDVNSENETTGTLDYVIYDPNGNLVGQKLALPANVFYTDTTTYDAPGLAQTSDGYYEIVTSFDPSINSSDLEGYWTVTCLWENNTEVGFYSQTISVRKSTNATFSWEEENNGGIMVSNDSNPIERINLQTIKAQIYYYNLSDFYVSGDGTLIKAAPVSYNTSWDTSGTLNYVDPFYEFDILVDAVSGNHSITLTATGLMLEEYSITIDIIVHHTFDIELVSAAPTAYYNDSEALIQFRVEDTSNDTINSYLTLSSTVISVYLDGGPLSFGTEYGFRELTNNLIQLELFSDSFGLNLLPGSHNINITVTSEGFFEDYGHETTSEQVSLIIQETPTEIVIISSEDELYFGNETTIVFNYMDTIHGNKIEDATFDVTFDIEDAELITTYELQGDYYIVFRVLEPQETSVNIFITINQTGFAPQTNLAIKSIQIINPETGKIPPFLFVIIGIFSLAAIIIPTVFIVRRKMQSSKSTEKALFSRIYGLYESVLSITKLIAVHKSTGLPVYEMDLGSEISLDPSLITGFLTAISSMGIELRGDRAGSVKRLQYKNFYVTGSESGNFTIYTFSEIELNTEVEDRLTIVSDWFAKMFNQIGEDWDGSTEVFRINLQGITEKIMKEIHLWIFYPFIISPYKSAEIEAFTGMRKTLATYIMQHDNVTISRIFDDLDTVRIEKGLPIIFEFIEEGILTPVFDAYKIATVRF